MRKSQYLNYLPRVFADADERGNRFLGRYLLAFEDIFTSGYRRDRQGVAHPPDTEVQGELVPGIEQILDRLARWFRPATCPHDPDDPSGDFLAWLHACIGLEWHGHLSEAEQRRLLQLAVGELYPKRGTPQGIRRALEIVARVRDVRIEENRWPANMQIGARSTIGVDTLLSSEGTIDRPHSFILHVRVPWHELRQEGVDSQELIETVTRRVNRVVEREKPAHTACHVWLSIGAMQIGLSSTIGEDTVLMEPRDHAD